MAIITPFDNYLDLVEAARELAIHPQSLRRLIKQKKIPATLFAGKYLIERDKLEMFKSNYDPRPGRKPIRRLLENRELARPLPLPAPAGAPLSGPWPIARSRPGSPAPPA